MPNVFVINGNRCRSDKERNKEERSRAYAQLALRFTSTGIILERGTERGHDSWKEVTSRRGEERRGRRGREEIGNKITELGRRRAQCFLP